MRVSELSRTTGVPLATIKFYRREGLLPPGAATAPNQASYGPEHVERLRLIRALTDVGGLSLADVRKVLAAADSGRTLHEVLSVTRRALDPDPAPDPDEQVIAAREEVERYLDGRGWRGAADSPGRETLADVLVTLRRLGRPVRADVFDRYAALAEELAAAELDTMPASLPREEAITQAVVGTVVFERALTALRRLAHEDQSLRRFAGGT